MLTIRGKLINHDSERYGEVSIDTDTGLIAKVGELSGTTPDIDAGENLVFPGFGDIHVHAREDASGTHTYKEDFRTASEAAVKGGVTFFAEMPNNPTPPIDDASYAEKEKLAAKSLVPVVLYGLINPGVKPLSRRVPYKFVIGKSFSHLIFNSFEEMEKTLSGYRGQSVSFHAEDMAILENSKNAPTHETRRPPKSEDKGVATAIDLIRKNGLEGKICHVSTREAMMQIREAKKDGVAISGEVTPHHLYFDESAFTDENHIWFQVNPPIRTREDRMAMIEALRNGDIDYLATDHAPHSIEEKQRGI